MSPETLQGKRADARSDVWALGVVLYQMLAGRLPFQGATLFEVSSAILGVDPPPLPAKVPSSLRSIVKRCLEKQPENRYQTAGEVRAALEAKPVVAMPSRGRRVWGLGVAAALAVAVLVWWQQGSRTSGRLTSTGAPASTLQEANEAFELAMQFQRVQSDLPQAQKALERAITLDPKFAEAHRYHAFNPLILLLNGYSNDISLAYKAEQELQVAAKLDPNLMSLPSAFTAVHMMQGRMELVPEEQLNRVLQKHPANNDSRLWRAIFHYLRSENAAAKEDLKNILDRELLNGAARMFLGEVLRMERDLQGAIQQQERVLEQAPGNISAIRYLATAYMDAGDLDKARRLLEEKRSQFSGNHMWRATWAFLLALEGKREEALETMNEDALKFLSAAPVVTLGGAEFYSVVGETSKAVEWLERAVRNGDERIEWFRQNPWLVNVRSDSRFEGIISSIASRRKERQAR